MNGRGQKVGTRSLGREEGEREETGTVKLGRLRGQMRRRGERQVEGKSQDGRLPLLVGGRSNQAKGRQKREGASANGQVRRAREKDRERSSGKEGSGAQKVIQGEEGGEPEE